MRTTGPSQSPLLLLDVIDVLDRCEILYAIVGAIAAAYHGVVRASLDADAVISLPSADIPVLADNLRTAGLREWTMASWIDAGRRRFSALS